MRIAYLTSRVMKPGAAERRSDAYEHDQMMAALGPALAARGATLEDPCWDDQIDWSAYDRVVIGTCWDYWNRQDEFLARLDRIAGSTRLDNTVALVRWNIHKGYLKDLEARGARLIPTRWEQRLTPDTLQDAFTAFGCDDIVAKRQVGAGAVDQYRLSRGDTVPDVAHPMMLQPFLPAIQAEGELSFIFIGSAFCHALLKRPTGGDYRIQSQYGGQETPYLPAAEDLQAAKAVLDTLDEPPLYARIDMLRADDGDLLLMELELIEPFLYPLQGPRLGEMMARALVNY